MQVLGIDISPKALNLARRNLYHNLQRGLLAQRAYSEVEFHRADVLGRGDSSIPGVEDILQKFGRPGVSDGTLDLTFDLLISNPPYISTSNFRDGTTARSVRLFEPRLALVPPIAESPRSGRERLEDVFYRRILALALKLRPRITVLECGDLTQARRVIDMHNELSPCHSDDTSVEVWPSTERDLAANGFHPHDGSRCVIIRRSVK